MALLQAPIGNCLLLTTPAVAINGHFLFLASVVIEAPRTVGKLYLDFASIITITVIAVVMHSHAKAITPRSAKSKGI